MSESNNLKNTSTDMMVNFMANTEKLVDEDNRWNYGDQDSSENHDYDEAELDEEVDQYVSDRPPTPNNNIQQNAAQNNQSQSESKEKTVFQKQAIHNHQSQHSNTESEKINTEIE